MNDIDNIFKVSGNSIVKIDGAEAVRNEVSRQLGSTDNRGTFQHYKEIHENAFDESRRCYDMLKEQYNLGKIPYIPEQHIFIQINEDGSFIVKDCGRGLSCALNEKHQIPDLRLAIENDNAGGKGNFGKMSENSSYSGFSTIGVHGAGSYLVNCTSEYFKITSTSRSDDEKINNKTFVGYYKKGVLQPINTIPNLPSQKCTDYYGLADCGVIICYDQNKNPYINYGTMIECKFDSECFQLVDINGNPVDTPIDYNMFKNLLISEAYNSEGIVFNVSYNSPSIKENFIIRSSDYNRINDLKKASNNEIYNIKFEGDGYKADFYLGLVSSPFVDQNVNGMSVMKSTQKVAFNNVLETIVNIKMNPFIVEGCGYKFNAEKAYYVGQILNIEAENIQFEGQTKEIFNSPILLQKLKVDLKTYLENSQFVEKLIEREKLFYSQRVEEYLAKKKEEDKKRIAENNKPKNFEDKMNMERNLIFPSCDKSFYYMCPLIIVEGTSAGLTVQDCKDANQACISLRGKFTNVVAKEDEIMSGLSREPEYRKLYHAMSLGWRCFVIFTDADADGSLIRTLILAMIKRHFPMYLRENRVFVVQSPLYRVFYDFTTSVRSEMSLKLYTEKAKVSFLNRVNEEKMNNVPIQESYFQGYNRIRKYTGISALSSQEITEMLKPDIELDNLNENWLCIQNSENEDYDEEIIQYFLGKSKIKRKEYVRTNLMTDRMAQYVRERSRHAQVHVLKDFDYNNIMNSFTTQLNVNQIIDSSTVEEELLKTQIMHSMLIDEQDKISRGTIVFDFEKDSEMTYDLEDDESEYEY